MTHYVPASPVKKNGPKMDEIRADYDRFEQRWSKDTGDYYWMNPFTGEILPESGSDGVINRSKSIWGPCDPPFRKGTSNRDESVISNMTSFVPQNYASRMWGRRAFHGLYISERDAARHICTVFRGHVARKRLRSLFATRFVRVLDKESGFYYFHDTKTDDSVWHKPYLAHPDDVPLEDPFKYYLPSSLNQAIYKKTTGDLKFNSSLHAPNEVYDGDRANGMKDSPSKDWAGHGLEKLVPTCISECRTEFWPYMVIRSWFDRYSDGIASLKPFMRAREKKDWKRLVQLFRMTMEAVPAPAQEPLVSSRPGSKTRGSRPGSKRDAKREATPGTPSTPTRPGTDEGDMGGMGGDLFAMESESVAAGWSSRPTTGARPGSHAHPGLGPPLGSPVGSPLMRSRGGKGRESKEPEPDLKAMRAHPKAHQVYALYCMNYLPVAVAEAGCTGDGKKLMAGTDDAIFLIIECLRSSIARKGPFDLQGDEVYKTFFFYLLANVMDTKGGRHGFFETPIIDDKYGAFGPSWEREREEEITARVNVLASFLDWIPTQVVSFRGSKTGGGGALGGKVTNLHVATRAGSELAESILLSLGMLARERDFTDIISLGCADQVVKVMPAIIDEVAPCVAALRCLYNCCFMNEMGQFAVLSAVEPTDIIKQYRDSGVGRDEDVARECRRLELALQPDGWRGRVEKKMTDDFFAARADSRDLKERMRMPANRVGLPEEKSGGGRGGDSGHGDAKEEKKGDDIDGFLAGWS